MGFETYLQNFYNIQFTFFTMIPKVIFRYSWIYDQRWKKWMEEVSKYPSTEEVLNYIKEV